MSADVSTLKIILGDLVSTVLSITDVGAGVVVLKFDDSATTQNVTDAKNQCLAQGFTTVQRVRTYKAILADVQALTIPQRNSLQTAALTYITNSDNPIYRLSARLIQLSIVVGTDKTNLVNELLTAIIIGKPDFAISNGVNGVETI